MSSFTCTVEQVVKRLEAAETSDFIVICKIYGKDFILTWLSYNGEGHFKYAFQPLARTAFYELGIGISEPEEDGLKNYLNEKLRNRGKLYCARSLEQVVVGYEKLTEIVADDKHTITIDGEDIEISHKSFIALKRSLLD